MMGGSSPDNRKGRTIPMIDRSLTKFGLLLALFALAPSPYRDDADAIARTSNVGKAYRIPYRLTETNHLIVRAKLNGAGPFNLVVDTGAPALYVSTEVAEKAGVRPGPRDFFSRVDRLEFEGGATLEDVQTRVEDVYQLVGMNALGLPGAKIDGMIGFNVLARFRLTIDPTDNRMTWNRLDFEPKDMVVPARARGREPAEIQAMGLLGGVAKGLALFMGKQPEDQRLGRGFLGLELAETDGVVQVAGLLPGSPAADSGLEVGDVIVRILGRDIGSLDDARLSVSRIEPGDRVSLRVRSGEDPKASVRELSIHAGEGL
ncbi:hypothetical protein BH23PLA1_BH23PLA1_26740 [soil metagenome]